MKDPRKKVMPGINKYLDSYIERLKLQEININIKDRVEVHDPNKFLQIVNRNPDKTFIDQYTINDIPVELHIVYSPENSKIYYRLIFQVPDYYVDRKGKKKESKI